MHVCTNACEYIRVCDVYGGAYIPHLYTSVLGLFPCVCSCELCECVNVACMSVCVHVCLYEVCVCVCAHVHMQGHALCDMYQCTCIYICVHGICIRMSSWVLHVLTLCLCTYACS